MADQLRLRGGDTATSATFVGALREVTVDTGLNALRIHDGVTPGGHLVELSASAAASRSVVAADSSTAREVLRAALEQTIENARLERNAAIQTSAEDLTTAYTAADAALSASITAVADRASALEADAVTKTYVDTAISDLTGGAPETLNQLNEIITAFQSSDSDLITDLAGLGVRITALESDATTATAVVAVQADVDANETAANAAIALVQADVDANETAANTAIAAVQADVDANELSITTALSAEENSRLSADASEASARQAADNALSGRLDSLEADPITATAAAAADATTLASANSYTDTSISNLVNGADAALDTLKEIGDALAQGDTDVTAALTAQITTESTTRAASDTALSGRLDVLEGQTLDARITSNDTDIAANTAAITAEETARIAADLAETSARTAAITAEATTRAAADAAETTARQNAITAEETARIAADNTLTANLATTNTNLTATNTAYAAADTNLQTQIDSVNAVEAAMEARNLRAGLCFGQLYVSDLIVA